MMSKVLIQYNVALMKKPFDDPSWSEFKSELDELHCLAEKDPGFIWRYAGEKHPHGYISPRADNTLVMGNLSAWRDYESLYDYTFSDGHLEIMKKKRMWFDRYDANNGVYNVLYHLDEDVFNEIKNTETMISLSERKLSKLAAYGPDESVFSWRK